MHGTNPPDRIKRLRNEILATLRMVYPAALQAESLFRSLISLFPTLEWEHLRSELTYLREKGYPRVEVPSRGQKFEI